MSGRGSLLSLFKKKDEPSEISASIGDQIKDSGLDANQSLSSGEYRRVARDNVASELATSFQNVNISVGRGRGRGHFLQTIMAGGIQPVESINTIGSSEGIDMGATSSKFEVSVEKSGSDHNQNLVADAKTCITKPGLFLPNQIYGVKVGRGRGRGHFMQTIMAGGIQPVESINTTGSYEGIDMGATSSKFEVSVEKSGSDHNQNLVADAKTCITKPGLFLPNQIYGVKGNQINVSTNYICLNSDPSKGVYLYEVRFNPNVDSIHLRIKYLNEHKDKFGGTKTFDGCLLYLPILLKEELTTFVTKTAENGEIEIRLLFKKKESLKDCIQLYNILFDRIMRTLKYVKFDRKNFDPTQPKIIPIAKLEVWPGYVTAVDEYDGGLMLCCDVSHRLLCQRTVLEELVDIYLQNKSCFQEQAKMYLLGSIIITRYNNRTYRIDDICFTENPQSMFETRNGSCSYIEYYKTHHNINIKDIKQPLLISKKQQKYEKNEDEIRYSLIPELCYFTGIHDDIRADKKLLRDIAAVTRVTPNQRILALEKYVKNVNTNVEAKQILANWGLTLANNNVSVVGRKLLDEQIYFANKTVSAGPNADFSRDATNSELLDVVHIDNWLLIYHKNDFRACNSFMKHMETCCAAFGMRINKPKTLTLDQDRIDSYVDALRRNIVSETQIVVCICPTSRDDRYSAIKKICCAELPVASQIINARTLLNDGKNRSIVQKIILQMNCKLGGSLWSVKIPFKKVMICGIDSYHDPSQKSSSVAAFVASLNATYTQWYSKAVVQTKREELVNGLTSAFECALKSYKRRNGYLPDSVIIYRDGVGDGQLNLCSMFEIPQFEAISGKNIKITFIVVQKRINTRFFTGSNNNYTNPSPGTVVDKGITRAQMYDFFLVSQSVRQGTVSPTHFVVLRDDSNYGPDIIQKLSYKLCFLYYNWPGTVCIPACCMYAHKMAYLIGQSVQRNTSATLAEKLFYL
ncbi:protein argonaute-3-like isoform X1 [Drosophila albomicans]|uniref:Protein argonaute-3-like isoform X1 n=1 Tax=Drosophila albomicans TaxID=7291 RepID=A0A9C6WGM0_DROAB|nr:protein argonaute-3-like isoform X1 [Drosophila albomicans]XP_051862424.1 protein argonaute-3-like isoform X1 [Drosophila albomicans]